MIQSYPLKRYSALGVKGVCPPPHILFGRPPVRSSKTMDVNSSNYSSCNLPFYSTMCGIESYTRLEGMTHFLILQTCRMQLSVYLTFVCYKNLWAISTVRVSYLHSVFEFAKLPYGITCRKYFKLDGYCSTVRSRKRVDLYQVVLDLRFVHTPMYIP
jgi:hypothetical protein